MNRRGNLRRRESVGWTDGEISVEGKAPEGTCLKSMNMEGKAGRAGYCPWAQCRSAGRCSLRHGKSRASGGRIFTEGKRQMNRRGNLRRRESTERNVSEKHEHGRQSEVHRVLSGGAMQKRRPV